MCAVDGLSPGAQREGSILQIGGPSWGVTASMARARAGRLAARPSRSGRGDWEFEALCEPFYRSFQREIWPVVKLRVRAGESIQEAVRRFRKLCERSGLRKEMRRKAYYEKPSERRRREELKRLRKARQHQTSRV